MSTARRLRQPLIRTTASPTSSRTHATASQNPPALRTFIFVVLGFVLFGSIQVANVSVAESLQVFGSPWHMAIRHVMWVAIGVAVFALSSSVSLSWWKRLAPWMFLGALTLLVAVLVPGLGIDAKGAQRWLALGPFSIQPAEPTKLALIVFFASWLEKHQRFAPFVALTGLIAGLILLQPNLSTAAILVFLATSLYFLAGGPLKPLLIFGALGSVALALLILSAPYRRERLRTFLDPSSDPLGRSYHIRQITLALGRGGWLGQGIGQSKQKQQYIPEASKDSTFAIWAEETGFLGTTLLLAAYTWLIFTLIELARLQEDPFGRLLILGVASWLSLHVILNTAAMTALVPLTGVPLPLISYGGSSLVSFLAGFGMVVGVSRASLATHPHRPLL